MALARITKFFDFQAEYERSILVTCPELRMTILNCSGYRQHVAGRVKISGFEFPSRFIRGPEPYAETDQRDQGCQRTAISSFISIVSFVYVCGSSPATSDVTKPVAKIV